MRFVSVPGEAPRRQNTAGAIFADCKTPSRSALGNAAARRMHLGNFAEDAPRNMSRSYRGFRYANSFRAGGNKIAAVALGAPRGESRGARLSNRWKIPSLVYKNGGKKDESRRANSESESCFVWKCRRRQASELRLQFLN